MVIVDNLIQHEERRRKIWTDAYVAAIKAGIGTPKYTANSALNEFDAKFPRSSSETVNSNGPIKG